MQRGSFPDPHHEQSHPDRLYSRLGVPSNWSGLTDGDPISDSEGTTEGDPANKVYCTQCCNN